MKTIYADFNNFIDDKYLDMECVGSLESIAKFKGSIVDGEEVWLSDGELRAKGNLIKNEKGRWTARSNEWKFEKLA